MDFHAKTEELIEANKLHYQQLLETQCWPSDRVTCSENLFECLAPKARAGAVCHVICSGQSLIDSWTKISPGRDAVIGFNFAALMNIEFDLYMAEMVDYQSSALNLPSRAQSWLLLDYARSRVSNLYFKNLWEGKINKDSFLSTYPSSCRLVRDVYVPYSQALLESDSQYQAFLVERLFQHDPIYLRQCIATVFTAIGIALHSGFGRIIIHGLDIVGGHFYTESSFSWRADMPADIRAYWQEYSTNPSTLYSKILSNQQYLVSAVSDFLRQRGVTLYSGSTYSPMALCLPVYEA